MFVWITLGLFLANLSSAAVIDTITPAQWAALNSSVGGRLAIGFPWAKPCYSVYNGQTQKPDAAACSAVQNGYKNDTIIVQNFGAYINTNWGICQATGKGCNLDYTAPTNPLVYAPPNQCYQGSVGPKYVNVAQPSDIQAVFDFARKTKVPLYIKNSGHDYKGRSSAPNALGIWTHNLQGIVWDKGFVPEGCSDGSQNGGVGGGVTFGSGIGFLQLYNFAEANNITIVGGSSPTVGAAGGWITGAGHSAVSNTLGLGVDNALQIRAVTPTGQYLTANRCQNQDLFFALRGGGGSTFGVITEVTFRANVQLTLQVTYIRFVSANLNAIKTFLKICIENGSKWAGEGWGGYIEPGAVSKQASGLVFMTPKLNHSEAVASMKPLTDFVQSLLALNIAVDSSVTEEPSYLTAYNKYLVPNEELVGLGTAVGSRLLPRDNFIGSSNQAALLKAFLNAVDTVTFPNGVANPALLTYGAPVQILVTAPSSYVGDNTSSITPAWRSTLWHVIINSAISNQATASDIAAAFKRSNKASNFFRAITPPGAYQNEADIFEPDYTTSFWGAENYAKLVQLKAKFDPDSLLQCWHCIGWNASDPRYACYPPAPS